MTRRIFVCVNYLLWTVATCLGCESVADLDEVKMADAEVDAVTSEAGSEGAADAPHDASAQDASDEVDGMKVPDAGDAGEVGVDAASDASPDAAPDVEADAGWFSSTCVAPGSVMVQCNPMTNEGCGAGKACDMAENAGEYGFVCFPDGTVDEGASCNGVSGPYCKATLHCGTTTCTKFCCTSADCEAPTPQCGMYDPGKVGTFGWCI